MNPLTLSNQYGLPIELWKNILLFSPQRDVARASSVNSLLLEISRDLLYFQLVIMDDHRLLAVLPALRNQAVTRRLRWIVFDPDQAYKAISEVEELLKILKSSSVVRLDLVPSNTLGHFGARWMHCDSLIAQFTQLQQLHYLKLDIAFFSSADFVTVLQARALRDLDISSAPLRNLGQPDRSSNVPASRPSLDTLRITRGAANWRNLLQYVDLGHMERLALWDYDQEIGNVKREWGDLFEASASTLQSLSLWLTGNIIGQNLLIYLESVKEFVALGTLSIFTESRYFDFSPPSEWTSVVSPIIVAFCARSPSIRRVRIYVQGWDKEFSYEVLLKDHFIRGLALGVARLQNLETIEFTHHSSPSPSSNIPGSEAQLADIFSPVRISIQYGVSWDQVWPFFQDKHPKKSQLPS
ncbi:hypothetical protein DL96DRAFT_569643 [Flagelloscypha sp. PMI_526]|nr:hypothetical protein DL96DRAFT_569643 [Flagelloscypha sp. PMI_526]